MALRQRLPLLQSDLNLIGTSLKVVLSFEYLLGNYVHEVDDLFDLQQSGIIVRLYTVAYRCRQHLLVDEQGEKGLIYSAVRYGPFCTTTTKFDVWFEAIVCVLNYAGSYRIKHVTPH